MSRVHAKGFNPEDGQEVDICWGYDVVPGFKSGFFFQVYSKDPEAIRDDPSGEGLIVNEGFLDGLHPRELEELATKWKMEPGIDPSEL